MAAMFVVADTHFGCKNALRYRHRPFDDVEHMNEAMVELWNSVVGPDDWVWHLGDFAVDDDSLESFAPRLNGRIAIVEGNHEQARPPERLRELFAQVYQGPLHVMGYGGDHERRDLWLCHYPVQRHGTIFTVTGHIHESWRRARRMLNVGVDSWHFRPVPLAWVFEAEDTEKKGYWDANAYPDAPLEWRVYVTSKIRRDHSAHEPTLPTLERELLDIGAPRGVLIDAVVPTVNIDYPFIPKPSSGPNVDPMPAVAQTLAGSIVRTGF